MEDEGEDLKEHLINKYGPSAGKMFENPEKSHLHQAGKRVGINFTNDRYIYPTIKAHVLMEYFKKKQQEEEEKGEVLINSDDINDTPPNRLMEEMYKAYFERGENINSIDVLSRLVVDELGLLSSQEQVEEIIEDGRAQYDIVQIDNYNKRQMRISGVPFFIIQPMEQVIATISSNDNDDDDKEKTTTTQQRLPKLKKRGRPVAFSGAQPPEIIAEQLELALES